MIKVIQFLVNKTIKEVSVTHQQFLKLLNCSAQLKSRRRTLTFCSKNKMD